VLWYATVRLLRPSLVVEAGVQEGLGTLVLLRALERNRLEGTPGRLISVDPLMNAGWLVPRRMRAEWRFVNEPSETGLEAVLSGERVDVLLSDSGGSYDRERSEYETAIRHASDRLVLIAGSGDQTSALPDVCAEHGLPYRYLQDQPARHFFRGSGTGIGLVRPDRVAP
jgi:hypothetical protein